MTGWNFNIDEAPRGSFREVTRTIGKNEVTTTEHVPTHIIAAGSGDVVTLSKWIHKEGRWNMFTKDCPPMAWKPWPRHPLADPAEVTK